MDESTLRNLNDTDLAQGDWQFLGRIWTVCNPGVACGVMKLILERILLAEGHSLTLLS
jgi:hypothetical protein